MGQIRKDGIIYGGVGKFIEGAFIDTTEYLYYETINEGSATRTTYSYTATEDCYASILSNASSSDGVFGILDNTIEVVRNPSSSAFVKVIFPMRKGQTVSFSNLGGYAYFYVMRLIEGTNVIPEYHVYSTEEHIVGTYFGDTLYEKTIVLTSGVSITDSWTTIYTDALIGNIAQLVDVKYNNVENKGVYGVLNYKPNGNNLQAVYPISGGLNVLAGARFTLQYTKTS